MTYRKLEEDRAFILSSTHELGNYLSSEVILWQMEKNLPPFTVGNLLLAWQRLTTQEGRELEQVKETLSNLIEKRRTAWEKKIQAELPMRLNQWRLIVEDFAREQGVDASYSSNVRTRTMLTLLLSELRYPAEPIQASLASLDKEMGRWTETGPFVWEQELEKAFPVDVHPYLYVKGKGRQ